MGVLKNQRSLSKMEFFNTALILRREITDLLLRDFGIKNRRRDIVYIKDKCEFTEEDNHLINEIFNKYGINASFLDIYPEWIIDKERIYIFDILRDLIKNITTANTIYITNKEEYYLRRNHQNLAISNCEDLLQEMQFIIFMFHTDSEKYMRYVDIILKEINLIKGWRKSDNKMLKNLG